VRVLIPLIAEKTSVPGRTFPASSPAAGVASLLPPQVPPGDRQSRLASGPS
jgi:hypothetical protein